MIRDFPPDPLPQGCPFSFVSKLEKNESTKVTKQALLGALRYKTCEIPQDPKDQMAREIKDWFAFALDEKTSGLWGYKNEGRYNFKITAGGKKDADPLNPDAPTEGKDQSLLEMWNQDGYGMTHYVNEGDGEAQAEGTANKKQSGFYYYSPGDANYFQLFVTDGESSTWGFSDGNWQHKLAAEANSTIFQMWKGPNGTSEDPPAGYAKMYAYDDAAGFSCSKSDDISSTLEPSSLYCIDESESDKQGKYYAAGANIWEDGIYTQIDPSSIWCFEAAGKESKFYAGGANMTYDGNFTDILGSTVDCWQGSKEGKYYAGGAYINNGSNWVDIRPPEANCYFQQVKVCVDGSEKTAWVLMSSPT